MKKRINKKQAMRLALYYNINLDVVPFEEFHYGLNVELEHGNITGYRHGLTAKIVIAHLLEHPRYYKYLKEMEEKFKKSKKSIYNK